MFVCLSTVFSDDGKIDRTGEGLGLGKNINVPFSYVENAYVVQQTLLSLSLFALHF